MAEKAVDEPSPQAEESKGVLEQMEGSARRDSPSESEEKVAEKPQAQKVTEKAPEPQPGEKQPSKLKQMWDKVGLDKMTLMMMFKGSVPPTVAIAMYQAKSVQSLYQTVGYLVAISTTLAFCIMPRGKYIQNIIINTFAICIAASINLLALFCAIKARESTTTPSTIADPTAPTPYNAAASTVLAIWLIVQTYVINSLRAARPQLQFPAILYSIFTNVSLTYGVAFPTMAFAEAFMQRLLEAFLTGFGLATATHFLIFPVSSRKVVSMEWTGYIKLLGGMLKMQSAYMASLSDVDPVKLKEQQEKDDEESAKAKHHHHQKQPKPHGLLETPMQIKFKELRQKLVELHTKIEADITPAKREIAFGKLESHDITLIWKHMRLIFLPVMGLASMITILETQAEQQGWAESEGTEDELKKRHRQVDNLHFLLKEVKAPFSRQIGVIDEAFQHILLTLELEKPPKKKKQTDEENNDDQGAKPGTPGFAEAYKAKVDNFYASKQQTLRDWCQEHGVDLPENFFAEEGFNPQNDITKDDGIRETYQRQLFFTLYLEYLLWRVSTSVLDLVLFVDKRKQDGIFKKSRIIFPGSKTLYKWLRAVFSRDELSHEDSYVADLDSAGQQSLYIGQQFGKKPDPEHLPPRNTLEKIGNAIRNIPNTLRSQESVHGFRVAAATMSIGIICYLRASQLWFLEQRLLWGMIMVAISMTRTSGQSIMNFVLRIAGTTAAMVGCYVIWYIVDGKIPGVIVFLWFWIFCAFYVVLKFPKFAIVGILSLVTSILIIGYELQVKAIGVALATANGQPAYPTYELAPYRLAIVAGGLFVAFIWTIFPFPVSESSEIRKDICSALYLMCSFYSIVHESMKIRVLNNGGDQNVKGTHAYNLEKARTKTFTQLLAILNNLQMNSAFSKFQLQVGGKFPRETYEQLIVVTQRIMLWTSLASYSSTTFEQNNKEGKELTKWSSDFRQMIAGLNINSNKITSFLSLLSSSLSNAQPLPPYLELPEPFQFVKMLENIDRDILSIRHIAEPEYSAFAVMQIVSQSINNDLGRLVDLVKNLVGEIDFSYHATNNSSLSTVTTVTSSVESSPDEKGKSD